MSYKIVVTPDAIENIENAVNYYKKEVSTPVAKLFIEDFKETFKDIKKQNTFSFSSKILEENQCRNFRLLFFIP